MSKGGFWGYAEFMNKYEKTKLSNGIRLILVPNQSTEVATIMAMYGVGSRNESEKIAGISHLLEHMHYMGTKKRPTSFEIAEFIESIGGEHNAFTSKENTGYYAKIMPKHLEVALDFLSDNLINSRLDEKDVQHEVDVIKQEINMYEDLPHAVCDNKFEEVVFGKNDLGRDIIGYKETLEKMTPSMLVNYKKEHYSPENLVIIIAGNMGPYSPDEIKNLITHYFPIEKSDFKKPSVLELNNRKNYEIITKDTAQAQIAIGFKTAPLDHKDTFSLDLLAIILGGAMSSRMFEEIREKRRLAYSVRSHTGSYKESGLFSTQAGVNEGKTLEAIEGILNEYKKIREEAVPEKELAKAKEIINGKLLIKFENSEELAYHYASDEILLGKIHTPKELTEIFNNLTNKDLLDAARKYFTDDRLGLCFVGKKLEKEKVEKIFKI